MISEEEENIMSTGDAIDEESINQSIIYPSSIRSVKRKLESASNEEFGPMHILDAYSPSESRDDVEELK